MPATRGDVELGLVGFPYRSARTYLGRAVDADGSGVDAVWFRERARTGGPLADPIVAAAAALLGCRRARVGVLDLALDGRGLDDAVEACATLADLGPGRFLVSVSALSPADAVAFGAELAAAPGERCELVVEGTSDDDVKLATKLGASWLADWRVVSADRFATLAAAVEGRAGILAVAPIAEGGDTTPTVVAERIERYVAAGARRVVVDNELGSDVSADPRAAHDATVATVRLVRLLTRAAGS